MGASSRGTSHDSRATTRAGRPSKLSRQVADTLDLCWANCRDERLRALQVISVVPGTQFVAATGHRFRGPAQQQEFNRQEILKLLDQQTGRLRGEVAASINRKRVPALAFHRCGPRGSPGCSGGLGGTTRRFATVEAWPTLTSERGGPPLRRRAWCIAPNTLFRQMKRGTFSNGSGCSIRRREGVRVKTCEPVAGQAEEAADRHGDIHLSATWPRARRLSLNTAVGPRTRPKRPSQGGPQYPIPAVRVFMSITAIRPSCCPATTRGCFRGRNAAGIGRSANFSRGWGCKTDA